MAKAVAFPLVLLLAAGCSADARGDSEANAAPAAAPPEAAAKSGEPMTGAAAVALPRIAGNEGGDSAALQGRLVASGPCLYVEAGGARFLIAAASPTMTWDAQTQRLRSDGRSFGLGEAVLVAGSQAGVEVPWTQAPPSGCDVGRVWIATSATAPS